MKVDNLVFKPTEKTPKINFDATNGSFEIEGVSIPEDTLAFYEPIFSWLDNYLETPNGVTKLTVDMKFFNTSSSKCLYTIFRKLETLSKSGKSVNIVWCYKLEDTDMFESGQDFKNLLSCPFTIDRIS